VRISELTDRQWVQIRAALRFWREVAEVSRQHPAEHPSVRDMFHEYGPLNISEIDDLLENSPENLYITPHRLACHYGLNRGSIQDRIKKHGIKPDLYTTSKYIYRVESLMPVVEEIEQNA
jgi:hypothetical protein